MPWFLDDKVDIRIFRKEIRERIINAVIVASTHSCPISVEYSGDVSHHPNKTVIVDDSRRLTGSGWLLLVHDNLISFVKTQRHDFRRFVTLAGAL